MKKNTIISLAAAVGVQLVGFCGEPYELVNDPNGYSYIQVNSDLESFSFSSDFKSIGNSGLVGFFKYEAGLEGDALKKYISDHDASDARFGKHVDGGVVDLGGLKAGDRIGFYLQRKNGDIVRSWNFATFHDTTYIAFDKNGGGKDEWMSISDVQAHEHEGPSGQPLPGIPVALVLGAAGVAMLRRGSRR